MISVQVLTHPWMLLWLLPMAAVVWYFHARSLSDFPLRQRQASLVVRQLLVMLTGLSLCDPVIWRETDRRCFVFLVDESLSVGAAAETAAAEYVRRVRRLGPQQQMLWLPFAAAPGRPQPIPDRPTDPATRTGLPKDNTDIAAAIEAAAACVPVGSAPHLVLLSDGLQTTGDAVDRALRSRIPVSVVPLSSRSDPEIQIRQLQVPAEVPAGEPFDVEITVHASHNDAGWIDLYRGEQKVASEHRTFAKGETRICFQQTIERDRLTLYRAQLRAMQRDTFLENNIESAIVSSTGNPRILVIDSRPEEIRDLQEALEFEGILVDVRPPAGLPHDLTDLQPYECLIVSRAAASEISQEQMRTIQTWVKELGGGFLMLGSDQSFGPGGYLKTPLEDILPLRCDFEQKRDRPSLGIVLVIDKSGSMAGDKLQLAASAAAAAAEQLGPDDQVAVLAFDGRSSIVSDMQPAARWEQIGQKISQLASSGGTAMYPALEMAEDILGNTSAGVKHVILLTDGITVPGDFAGLARQLHAAGITISAIAVGDQSDTELLEMIAGVGDGRFYPASTLSQIPQIVARETIAAGRTAVDEEPFLPQVVRTTHALKDVGIETAPFLLGHVRTRPKATAEVILATEDGDPLLAWWRYGLGMTTAFTSDASARWAAEWLSWPAYGKFWTQVIRQTMRSNRAAGMELSISGSGRHSVVTVDALNSDGQYLNGAAVTLTLVSPDGGVRQMTLPQSAPGRYARPVELPERRICQLEVSVMDQGVETARLSRPVMAGGTTEHHIRPADIALLQQIARVSGGLFDPTPQQLLRVPTATSTQPVRIWPALLTVAAWLLVLDVALRRIDLSRLIAKIRKSEAP